MTRRSTFTRHWLSQSRSRHSQTPERLPCLSSPGQSVPVSVPAWLGWTLYWKSGCCLTWSPQWLVLPLNHTMTRVSCSPAPASGHSPGLCHESGGQPRSQPCSVSLTWQAPLSLCLPVTVCHDISEFLCCFRVPDVHHWLSLWLEAGDHCSVSSAHCPVVRVSQQSDNWRNKLWLCTRCTESAGTNRFCTHRNYTLRYSTAVRYGTIMNPNLDQVYRWINDNQL